jgi:hypothetical protein
MTLFEKLFDAPLTAENTKQAMPLSAHPITVNPDPHSLMFVERQFIRLTRIKGIDSDEANEERKKCKENLLKAAKTIHGKAAVVAMRLKYGRDL